MYETLSQTSFSFLPYASKSFVLFTLFLEQSGSSSLRFTLDFFVTWTDVSVELLPVINSVLPVINCNGFCNQFCGIAVNPKHPFSKIIK